MGHTPLVLSTAPATIVLVVTANFSDGSSQDITTDTSVIYNNRSDQVITGISGSPGEYTVLTAGEADIQVVFQSQTFIAKITIP